MIVYGINPVIEALRARRVTAIRVARRSGERLGELLALAAEQGLSVRQVDDVVIDRQSGGGVHQGVIADVEAPRDYSVRELVDGSAGVPLLIVLDGIEDPHNLGAILRSADAAGADGVVIQSRRSASLDGAAAKASAGAVAYVRVAEVVNIARALEELRELGVWTVGLAGEASAAYDAVDFTLPTAIVVGAEGSGLRRLVRDRCDWLVGIPMQGHVGSLNVSVAAGVTLFEAARQRRVRQSNG